MNFDDERQSENVEDNRDGALSPGNPLTRGAKSWQALGQGALNKFFPYGDQGQASKDLGIDDIKGGLPRTTYEGPGQQYTEQNDDVVKEINDPKNDQPDPYGLGKNMGGLEDASGDLPTGFSDTGGYKRGGSVRQAIPTRPATISDARATAKRLLLAHRAKHGLAQPALAAGGAVPDWRTGGFQQYMDKQNADDQATVDQNANYGQNYVNAEANDWQQGGFQNYMNKQNADMQAIATRGLTGYDAGGDVQDDGDAQLPQSFYDDPSQQDADYRQRGLDGSGLGGAFRQAQEGRISNERVRALLAAKNEDTDNIPQGAPNSVPQQTDGMGSYDQTATPSRGAIPDVLRQMGRGAASLAGTAWDKMINGNQGDTNDPHQNFWTGGKGGLMNDPVAGPVAHGVGNLADYYANQDPVGKQIAAYLSDKGDPAAAQQAQSMGPADNSPSAQKLLGLHQLEQTDPEKARAAKANFIQMYEHQRWAVPAAIEGNQQKPGSLIAAAQAATQAMTNMLDGQETTFTPNTSGGITATVTDPETHKTQAYQMTPQQFYNFFSSNDAQYDHVHDLGVAAQLAKYMGQQGGQQGAMPVLQNGDRTQIQQATGQAPSQVAQGGPKRDATGRAQGYGHGHDNEEDLVNSGLDRDMVRSAIELNNGDVGAAKKYLMNTRLEQFEKNSVAETNADTAQSKVGAFDRRTVAKLQEAQAALKSKHLSDTVKAVSAGNVETQKAITSLIEKAGVNPNTGAYDPDQAMKAIMDLKRAVPALAQALPDFSQEEMTAPQTTPARGQATQPGQAGYGAPQARPPQEVLDFLMKNPGMASQFDERYGKGAAQRYLRQKGQ